MTTSLETRIVHSGERRRNGNGVTPTAHPIYTSTTYVHPSARALDEAFERGDEHVYARHGNPTSDSLETLLADIEGGRGAVACSSGMSALHVALLAAGTPRGSTEPRVRHILASQDLYGATHKLLEQFFAAQGTTVSYCDFCDTTQTQEKIVTLEPDVVLFETISNPLLKIPDVKAICEAAHRVDARVIADATMSTPILCQPISLGADFVVHSATKYLSGHGDATGGVIVTKASLTLDTARHYVQTLGCTIGALEARLIARGVRTLALRVQKQCENACRFATVLSSQSHFANVIYPGLPTHPQHALASAQFGGWFGGIVSIELKSATRDDVFRFIDRLRLVLPATSLGDIFTLVTYPVVSSHRDLTPEQRHTKGIGDNMLRFSIGIENVDDILEDIRQALTP
jgi:cystathionine gamma-synthase/methionine-gamma-lyase